MPSTPKYKANLETSQTGLHISKHNWRSKVKIFHCCYERIIRFLAFQEDLQTLLLGVLTGATQQRTFLLLRFSNSAELNAACDEIESRRVRLVNVPLPAAETTSATLRGKADEDASKFKTSRVSKLFSTFQGEAGGEVAPRDSVCSDSCDTDSSFDEDDEIEVDQNGITNPNYYSVTLENITNGEASDIVNHCPETHADRNESS